MNAAIIPIILQLIFLECILSIDNAAVMGAMVAHLPNDQPPPWPKVFGRSRKLLNRVLGPQRDAALRVGLFGAYAGRVLMLALATIIIKLEWVQILGAAYLFYLAIDHFANAYQQAEHTDTNTPDQPPLRAKRGFWQVVIALNLADMAFSLDNVVAAIALSEVLWVVIIGVAIGILIIRFAASIFTRLITWEPALEHAAYLLLLAIGGELLLNKLAGIAISELIQFSISVGILLLTIIVSRVRLFQPLLMLSRRFMVVFAAIQSGIAALFALLLLPLRNE
jgi:YkoY family integral membrane protein